MNKLDITNTKTSTLTDFLLFRNFATPVLLQLLFWSAIAGNLYGTWWLYTHDNWVWMMSITFGTILIRVIFENLILRYQTFTLLKDIRDKLNEAD